MLSRQAFGGGMPSHTFGAWFCFPELNAINKTPRVLLPMALPQDALWKVQETLQKLQKVIGGAVASAGAPHAMRSPQRSPKRADRRRDALVQAFGKDFEGLADVEKPKAHAEEQNKALHRLRCTRFTRARVDDLIQVVEATGLVQEGGKPNGEAASARHKQYAAAADVLASQNALLSIRSADVAGEDGGASTQAVRLLRFKNLMTCALSWRVSNMDVRRFSLKQQDGDVAPDLQAGAKGGKGAAAAAAAALRYEKVLEAMVPTREQRLSNDATLAWFEVVPADKGRVESVLAKLWNSPDKGNFRGIRSLYNLANSRYLGIQLKDVDEFVRKQELNQMLEPTPVGVYSPLVPTKLGWHQVDIMFATWDSATPKITEEELKRTSVLQGDIRTKPANGADVEELERMEKRDATARNRGIREEFLKSTEKERDQLGQTLAKIDTRLKQQDAEYRALLDTHRGNKAALDSTMIRELTRRFSSGEPDTVVEGKPASWAPCKFIDVRKNSNFLDKKARIEILTDYREIINEKLCTRKSRSVLLWQIEDLLQGTEAAKWLKEWKRDKKPILEGAFENSPKSRLRVFLSAFMQDGGEFDYDALEETWSTTKQREQWASKVNEYRENETVKLLDMRKGIESTTLEKNRVLVRYLEIGGKYRGYANIKPAKKKVGFAGGSVVIAPRNWHFDLLGGAKTRTQAAKSQTLSDGEAEGNDGSESDEEVFSEVDDGDDFGEDSDSAAAPAKKRGPPPTKYPYIMNVMDIYSKYAWSFPLKTAEAAEQCAHLERLWLQEGAPEILQTDGGFKSLELVRLAERFGVEHRSCAPYHSQCSGAIERLNRTIRGSIRKAKFGLGVNLRRYAWVDFLPQIIASYNAMKHSTTQFAPYFIQRGRELHVVPVVALQRREPTPAEAAANVPVNLFWKEPRSRKAQPVSEDALAGGSKALPEEFEEKEEELLADNRPDYKANVIGRTVPRIVETVYNEISDYNLPKADAERGQKRKEQIERVQTFVEQSKDATERRDAIVRRGLRHAAVGMTADALIKAGEHLRPLVGGTLVRVSFAHLNLKVRQELKCGFKRARDLNSWSEDLYYVMSPPARGDKLHNHGSLYKVNKVGKVASPGEPDLLVTRQDLLALTPASSLRTEAERLAELQSLLRGEDAVVKKYVTLRQNYDAPTAQRRR
jgi:hypothetical protein